MDFLQYFIFGKNEYLLNILFFKMMTIISYNQIINNIKFKNKPNLTVFC